MVLAFIPLIRHQSNVFPDSWCQDLYAQSQSISPHHVLFILLFSAERNPLSGGIPLAVFSFTFFWPASGNIDIFLLACGKFLQFPRLSLRCLLLNKMLNTYLYYATAYGNFLNCVIVISFLGNITVNSHTLSFMVRISVVVMWLWDFSLISKQL